MKAMKKWLCKGLSAALIAGILSVPMAGSAVFADETSTSPVKVELNGTILSFGELPDPVNVDGYVLVPMRIIFESMGAAVDWDPDTLTATGTLGNQTVRTSVGSICAFVNEERVDLAVPSQIVAGTTMVPVRVVTEGLNAKVGWVEATNTVTIELDKTDMGGPENQDQNGGNDEDEIPADEAQKSSGKDYSDAYFPLEEGGYYYLQSVLPSGGCLLTCLAMVASNIHREIISPEDVYSFNGSVVRVGSWNDIESDLKMKRAETIDFNEVAVEDRLDVIAALVDAYPEGVIIGFNKQGSWHYVVVMDYDEDTQTLLVNDPVGGHRVPLVETWTGNKKFTSQEDAISYLQNGKAFVHKDDEKRTVTYKEKDKSESGGTDKAASTASQLPQGL